MRYSTSAIRDILNAHLHGPDNLIVKQVLTDSRSLVATGDTAFFAIPGLQYDGHDFVPDLYDAGVRVFVVEDLPPIMHKDAAYLHVDNVVHALQKLMADRRSQFDIPVISITGSNGKTIVKEWVSQLLTDKYTMCRSPKSYNSQIGVPLSVSLLEERHDMAVFEAGISRKGEMKNLQSVIQPQIGLLTNLGQAHQENFASLEEKLTEKLYLFEHAQTVILPVDDDRILSTWHNLYPDFPGRVITWAKNRKDAGFYVTYDEGQKTTDVHMVSDDINLAFTIPFADKASQENAVSTALLLYAAGLGKQAIEDGMPKLQPVAMRLEIKEGIRNCTVINDSYNSDVNALKIALDFAERQNKKNLVVILSDILQSGKDKSILYQSIAGLVNANPRIESLIGIGRDISPHADLFKSSDHFFTSTGAFLDSGIWQGFEDKTVLLKGARPFRFETISRQLEAKAHQTMLEVKLEAVTHNLKTFRSLLPAETKMMVMVKAFSYGSGSVEIGRHLQNQAVDYLGVAIVDEGVDLRKAGVHVPIMVMNPQPAGFDLMYEYKLEPEVYSLKVLGALVQFVQSNGIPEMGIHLKLDTGMHRLGICEHELDELLAVLRSHPSLRLKSVFSHLAGSDVPGLDEFTRHQLKAFKQMADRIADETGEQFIRHIANTNGIVRFPDARLDMVRLGIGLYGVGAANSAYLENAVVFKTRIISIKQLDKGDTVGYNRAGEIFRPTAVAVIPVGYGDGLSRKLGNGRWNVEVNGVLCPIIGDVCMDMCMVDLSGTEANSGDEVIVFGGKAGVEDMAETLETIPYEVLTGISQRVKRVYMMS